MSRGTWGLGGLLGAALALIAGEVILTATSNSASGANQLVSLAQAPGQLADRWMDPATPLIPDRQAGPPATAATSTTAASSSATAAPLSVSTLLQTTT